MFAFRVISAFCQAEGNCNVICVMMGSAAAGMGSSCFPPGGGLESPCDECDVNDYGLQCY